jgi:iron complex outermembrane receptor protein
MKTIHGLLLGACGAALLAGQTAYAQDANGGIETVIVTGERQAEDYQKAALTEQAFSGKQIEDLGLKSSADLSQVTPNLDIALPAGSGNQPIITIRGIGLNDYDTNNAGPNGIYVDDVYLSSPASQTFAMFDLKDVQVLEGPQGTLFGRNTSGGAILFTTAKPSDDFEANFHAEYSSFDTTQFEGAIGGQIAPGLDGRVAIVKNNSMGDFYNTFDHTHENGSNNIAGRAMLQWQATDDLTILFNVHGGSVANRPIEYRHLGDLDPSGSGVQCTVAQTYAGSCVDLFGYGTPSNFYHGEYNRRLHLDVHSVGGYMRADYAPGWIDLTSITSFEHNDKLHPEDSDASPNRLLEINFGVRANTFTQEFRATGHGENYSYQGGLYYLNENLHQNQPIFILLDGDNFFGGPGAADGVAFQAFDQSQQITNAYAAYAQGDYDITDALKLTLGARGTTETRGFRYLGQIQYQQGGENNFGPLTTLANVRERQTSSAFNWKAALSYQVADKVLVYGSVTTGYKSGDFNGSFLSTDPAEIARQLAPVKPENVTAFEIGEKSSFFDDRLILNASAFYNQYRDMQVFVLVNPVAGGSGLPVNVLDNAPQAHTEGVDADVKVRPLENLTGNFQFGVLETRIDKFVANVDPTQPNLAGKQLPLSPHFSMSATLDYTVPFHDGNLDFQFNADFKSHQFFDVTNDLYTQQNAYWLENVRIAYAFDDSQWEVAAFARNIGNQKYFLDEFDLSSPFGFIQGITGMPRTVGGEVNFRM